MKDVQWCDRCGARHEKRSLCAELIDATGPERFGWRVRAMSDSGTETFGVLIAQCDSKWRARVVTFPNMLWSVPGGRSTMKFVGATAADVERQAKQFIVAVCQRRELTMTEIPVEESPGAVQAEGVGIDAGSAARSLQQLRLRFGVERARQEARTTDVSAKGLFIASERQLPVGRKLKMLLDIDSFTVPLVGTIRWAREQPDGGRPAGMGVELHGPPSMYSEYTERLRKQLLAEQAELDEQDVQDVQDVQAEPAELQTAGRGSCVTELDT
jgi:Tfp pilus assembly protein PilZ